MLNPHPPLAAFPLVLTVLVVGFELCAGIGKSRRCSSAAAVLLKVLCVIAPATYFSGYWGAEQASQTFSIDEELILAHQQFGKLFLLSLVPTLLFAILRPAILSPAPEPTSEVTNGSEQLPSPTLMHYLYYLSLLASLLLVMLTSARGGGLVFEHGAGVYAPLP